MDADPFSFDAPLKPIDNNFAKHAGRKHDAWFATAHEQLLRAPVTRSKKRAAAQKPTGRSPANDCRSSEINQPSSTGTRPRRPASASSTRSAASQNGAANGRAPSALASTRPVKARATAASTGGVKRTRDVPSSSSAASRSGSALKRRAKPAAASGAALRRSDNKPNTGTTSKRHATPAAGKKIAASTHSAEDALAAKLAAHNSKFSKTTSYEPRAHGVRDVRRWERASGKTYSKLPYAERAEANAEIAEMKKRAAAEAASS